MNKRFKVNVSGSYILDIFKERSAQTAPYMLNHTQSRGGEVLMFVATFRESRLVHVEGTKVQPAPPPPIPTWLISIIILLELCWVVLRNFHLL
jgi:hypothetical protein